MKKTPSAFWKGTGPLLAAAWVFFFAILFRFFIPPHGANRLAALGGLALFFGMGFYRPRWLLFGLAAAFPLLNNLWAQRFFGWFPPPLFLLYAGLGGRFLGPFYRENASFPHRPPRLPRLFAFAGLLSAAFAFYRYRDGLFHPLALNHLGETSQELYRQIFSTLALFLAGPLTLLLYQPYLRRVAGLLYVLKALCLGLAGALLMGLAQKAGWGWSAVPEHFVRLGRLNATFHDPNALGLFMGMGLPLFIGWALSHKKSRFPFLPIGAVLAALPLLFWSGSRTGLLTLLMALLAGAAAFAATARNRERRQQLAAGFVVLLVGAILFTPLGKIPEPAEASPLTSRLLQTWNRAEEMGVKQWLVKDRGFYWQRAWTVANRYPWTGLGLGAYWLESINEAGYRADQPLLRDNANHWYLQMAAEMGWPVAALGAVYILLGTGLAWRRCALCGATRHKALYAALAGVLTAMPFIFWTGPHTNFAEIQLLYAILLAAVWPPPSRHVFWQPFARSAAVLFLLFYGICQCATLEGPLQLSNRLARFDLQQERGLHPWEGRPPERMRWTREKAHFFVKPEGPEAQTTLFVSHPDVEKRPVTVRLFVAGEEAAREDFTHSETRAIRFSVPWPVDKPVEVRLEVSRSWVPAEMLPDNGDTRELGVLMKEWKYDDPAFGD